MDIIRFRLFEGYLRVALVDDHTDSGRIEFRGES
jgi:hypothetical protein